MRAAHCAVWGFLLGTAALVMAPAAVRAQVAASGNAEAEAEYAELVTGALSEFEQGRWQQARSWFERAHALRPNARTFWGLGITAFELGRYAQAMKELGTALRDPRLPLDEGQRQQAQDVLARAAQHVGVLSVELEPERAELSIDGEQTAERELVLEPGRYLLAARASGFQGRELHVQVAPGDKRHLQLSLPPISLQVPQAAAQPAVPVGAEPMLPRDDDGEDSVLEQWWFWTAVGLVVAGGVAAVVVLNDDGDDAPKVNVWKPVLTRQP